jgi:hypothetical protein
MENFQLRRRKKGSHRLVQLTKTRRMESIGRIIWFHTHINDTSSSSYFFPIWSAFYTLENAFSFHWKNTHPPATNIICMSPLYGGLISVSP